MKRRLTLWRRKWCAWRGHESWDVNPIVLWYEGTVIRAWRCKRHDKPE